MQGTNGPPAAGLEGLWGMFSQLGFPNPQVVIQELQRLNTNLEVMRPDIHAIAQSAGYIQQLAQGMQNVKPQDVNRLIQSLDRASTTGEQLYQQLWGKR